MPTIERIHAREVLDSRGNPTVEVEAESMGRIVYAIVPSGASTGEHEALELRDKDNRFHGKGVLKAVRNVNEVIAPKLIGEELDSQERLDRIMLELDGTELKTNLGANAILGVSLAIAKLMAGIQGKWVYEILGDNYTIPVPLLNVINGGKHAGGKLAIQEFMIVPHGFETFAEALRAGSEIYHSLKLLLKKKYGVSAVNVGDEGGFAPPIDKSADALRMLVSAIEEAGYSPREQVSLAIDAAASEFFHEGVYHVDDQQMTVQEMVDLYSRLTEEFPLISIEDPFDENDFDAFSKLMHMMGDKIAIVADDLTVTNVNRIKRAMETNAANYLLLKVNQIGSLTEALDAATLCRQGSWGIVVSHRSGETEDPFIADLAVAIRAERIKTGAPARSERTAKYNQLLRIEEKLGDKATYQGTLM